MVLIGVLQLSDNGNFFLTDNSCSVPVVLLPECSDCSECDILKYFKNSDIKILVAVQEFDIVFESLGSHIRTCDSQHYIRTSSCRIFILASFYKSKYLESDSKQLIQSTKSNLHLLNEGNQGNVNYTINNSILDFQSLSINDNSEYSLKKFIVLTKMWSCRNDVAICTKVLVLFLSDDSDSNLICSSECENVDDTFNFYETGDDQEFANLISKISFMSLEDQQGLAYLSFESKDYRFLFPRHVYSFKLSNCLSSISSKKKSNEILEWNIPSSVQIYHDENCIKINTLQPLNLKVISIGESVLQRPIESSTVICGVLIEKTHEDSSRFSGSPGNQSKATLCLKLKDMSSSEVIKAYVPNFTNVLWGLLPGVVLRLHGFFRRLSHLGNLYLKASSLFGIDVVLHQDDMLRFSSYEVNPRQAVFWGLNDFKVPLQKMCFILKIMSADIYCESCYNNFRDGCSCRFSSQIVTKVKALIDDGTQQLIAYCGGENAQKVLNIDDSEWASLKSFVQLSFSPLRYSENAFLKETSSMPFINQVFYNFCASKASCRQLLLEYIPIPYFDSTNIRTVSCTEVHEVKAEEVMYQTYMDVKNRLLMI